jgi:hypothetical protein
MGNMSEFKMNGEYKWLVQHLLNIISAQSNAFVPTGIQVKCLRILRRRASIIQFVVQ